MKEKVLLGMSGGVDSSVSAILLQKQGYEVVGATMRLWESEDQASASICDAQKVCKKLGIEHHVVDLRCEFRKRVIDNFVDAYENAKTPNPCIECNKYMKFDAFYNIAQELNCKYIATGHYAKIEYSNEYNQYVLKKSLAEAKDQTYFLYRINKKILPYVIFPLADFTNKVEIRKIAEENGLEVAQKRDSQEVCFIPNNNYIEFIKSYSNSVHTQSGNIVLKDGTILGKHNGLINYTIGQRKGLGISYKEPLYVIKLDKEKNEVVVGVEKDLYSKELKANELNFLIDMERLMGAEETAEIKAKVRYRSKEADAILKLEGNLAKLEFKEPQRAITSGQSVVFYKNDVVLGGGKII